MKWKTSAAATFLIVMSASPVASQTLTVSVTGSGKVTGTGINCPSDCSEALPPPPPLSPVKGATVRSRATVVLAAGTPVVLTALGFSPPKWGGACQGTTGSTCTVTVPAGGATVSAVFATQTQSGMCTDTGIGQLRAIVKPTAAQLVINEWMPDPTLVVDTAGEWFELRSSAAFDLNGLQAGTTTLDVAPLVPAGGNCVPIAAGGFALFARTSMTATNGIPLAVDGTFNFSLAQSNGTLQIGIDGTALDTKTWTITTAARSHMIDTDGTQCVAPVGVPQYNPTDVGTPRATNTPSECP